MILDMFNQQCPIPLVAAKKEIDAGKTSFTVLVDNETAVRNLTHLGEKTGHSTTTEIIEGGFSVGFALGEGQPEEHSQASRSAVAEYTEQTLAKESKDLTAVFVGSECIGQGDEELGRSLMKMALYTLAQDRQPPQALLFMNSGVKLLAQEGQCVESVQDMLNRGSEVLVCGTCLNFYGLTDQLKVGHVSNMYDILDCMHKAQKVLSL